MKEAGKPLSEIGSDYTMFSKARDLKNTELRHYAMRRLGLVIDSTGWDYSRISKPVQKLRALGYDVSMVFVKTSLPTAIRRAAARGKEGGRKVPEGFIVDAWEGAMKNLQKYRALFGKKHMFVVDNDEDVEKKTWTSEIGPSLRKIGQKILNAPLKNTKGKLWLARQTNPDTRDMYKKKKKSEWPKPKPKPQPKPERMSAQYYGKGAARKDDEKTGKPKPSKIDLRSVAKRLIGQPVGISYRPAPARSMFTGQSRILPRMKESFGDTVSPLNEGLALESKDGYNARGHPDFKTLSKYRAKLTGEERSEVLARKAVWHMGNEGKASPAVWKSVIKGRTWYVTNTHRAFNVASTLKGAINRYHKFIKSTT